jgi:hypothetical protein
MDWMVGILSVSPVAGGKGSASHDGAQCAGQFQYLPARQRRVAGKLMTRVHDVLCHDISSKSNKNRLKDAYL